MNSKNIDVVTTEICVNQKQFTCDVCPKRFFTKFQYLVHSIVHLSSEDFNCLDCEEGFAQILNLDKHLEIHNTPMGIFCHVCKKMFFNIDSLNEHVKNHNGEFSNALTVKQEPSIEETLLKTSNEGKCGSYYNERREQCTIENYASTLDVQNSFECDRCKRVFSEKHQFDDHCRNICIKKELNSGENEEVLPFATISLPFNAHESDDGSLSQKSIKKELYFDKDEERSVAFTAVDDFHVSDVDDEPLSPHCHESTEKCSIENPTSSDSLQNFFRCDRCNKKFLEKHNLDEHQQNPCIKKELDSVENEEIQPSTSASLPFHAPESDDVSSPVSQKCKIRVFTYKRQEQKNEGTNMCSKNFPKIKQFVCELCQKVFSNKSSLTIHLLAHSNHKTFSCHLCSKKFTLKSLLHAHIRTHATKKFFCSTCQEVFSSEEKLSNHVDMTHSAVEPLSCVSQMIFLEKDLLEKYDLNNIKEEASKKEFECALCSKVLLNETLLNVHESTHATTPPYVCDVCSKQFKRSDNLLRHYLIHTGEESSQNEFKCGLCSKVMSNKKLLSVHESTHATSPPYVCDVCSKQFNRTDNLLRHYLIHTGEKPFKCETCGKNFRQKSDVTKHINHVHSLKEPKSALNIKCREKSFKCETCGKGFTSKQSIQAHEFQHTGKTPHVCTICNKGFARKFQLKDHLPSHSGEKPFMCKSCGKKFVRKASLKVHSAIHGEYTPFKCEVCQKAFGKRALLTKHIRVHTGERPFACVLCDNAFTQKSHLVTHLQGVHKKELAASCS